jgi:hypothetical protein
LRCQILKQTSIFCNRLNENEHDTIFMHHVRQRGAEWHSCICRLSRALSQSHGVSRKRADGPQFVEDYPSVTKSLAISALTELAYLRSTTFLVSTFPADSNLRK